MNTATYLPDTFPARLCVVLTTACNLSCIMCKRTRTNKTFGDKEIQKLKSLLPYLKVISWQGGEVFQLGYFKELFQMVAKNYSNVRQDIITNGLFIDEDWAEKLTQSKVSLSISIDGFDKQTYEYIRGGAKYEALQAALTFLNKMEKRYGSLEKQMNIVVMEANYDNIRGMVKFANEFSFKRLFITPVRYADSQQKVFYDRGKAEFIKNEIRAISEDAKNNSIEVLDNVTGFVDSIYAQKHQSEKLSQKQGKDSQFCQHPWKEMFIDISREGNIFPDCFCIEPIGNIYKDDLIDVWNGPLMQKYRARILAGSASGWCCDLCVNGSVKQSENYNYDNIS